MLLLQGDKRRYLYFLNGDYELFKRMNCVKEVRKRDEICSLIFHLKQSVHRTATTKAGHFMTRVGITATQALQDSLISQNCFFR